MCINKSEMAVIFKDILLFFLSFYICFTYGYVTNTLHIIMQVFKTTHLNQKGHVLSCERVMILFVFEMRREAARGPFMKHTLPKGDM